MRAGWGRHRIVRFWVTEPGKLKLCIHAEGQRLPRPLSTLIVAVRSGSNAA